MMTKNELDICPQTLEWRISDGFVSYPDALTEMESRAKSIYEGQASELVWLLEHPPLYTAGTSAQPHDLVDPERFPVYDAGRGGQYTYHGPGQRVVYFILDLRKRGKDVRRFVWNLEELIIQTIASFDIQSGRRDSRVGVWVNRPDKGPGTEDKIAAIGVRVKRWVTLHGIAINVHPDLDHFSGIIPCGINEHGVTSFHDMGRSVSMKDVDAVLHDKFDEIFGLINRPMLNPTNTDHPQSSRIEDTHPSFQI